jgi:hypothetical protein
VQDTMNDAFKWFGCSKPGADRRAPEAASSSQAVLHDAPAVD